MSKADEMFEKLGYKLEIDVPTNFIYQDKENEFEIIEDEIDIQDIKPFEIDENNYIQTDLGAFKTRKMDIAFLNKINEIIRATKELDNKINK